MRGAFAELWRALMGHVGAITSYHQIMPASQRGPWGFLCELLEQSGFFLEILKCQTSNAWLLQKQPKIQNGCTRYSRCHCFKTANRGVGAVPCGHAVGHISKDPESGCLRTSLTGLSGTALNDHNQPVVPLIINDLCLILRKRIVLSTGSLG